MKSKNDGGQISGEQTINFLKKTKLYFKKIINFTSCICASITLKFINAV